MQLVRDPQVKYCQIMVKSRSSRELDLDWDQVAKLPLLLSLLRGFLARADVSPAAAAAAELLLRPLCKSKVRPPGPAAAHPLPPARPHSFGPPPPALPKKRGFSGRKFLLPGSIFSILHFGCGGIGYCAVWGPLSLSVSG